MPSHSLAVDTVGSAVSCSCSAMSPNMWYRCHAGKASDEDGEMLPSRLGTPCSRGTPVTPATPLPQPERSRSQWPGGGDGCNSPCELCSHCTAGSNSSSQSSDLVRTHGHRASLMAVVRLRAAPAAKRLPQSPDANYCPTGIGAPSRVTLSSRSAPAGPITRVLRTDPAAATPERPQGR